jgi:hypothetical protein
MTNGSEAYLLPLGLLGEAACLRNVAQLGSAPEWGSGGRWFKSSHSDIFARPEAHLSGVQRAADESLAGSSNPVIPILPQNAKVSCAGKRVPIKDTHERARLRAVWRFESSLGPHGPGTPNGTVCAKIGPLYKTNATSTTKGRDRHEQASKTEADSKFYPRICR